MKNYFCLFVCFGPMDWIAFTELSQSFDTDLSRSRPKSYKLIKKIQICKCIEMWKQKKNVLNYDCLKLHVQNDGECRSSSSVRKILLQPLKHQNNSSLLVLISKWKRCFLEFQTLFHVQWTGRQMKLVSCSASPYNSLPLTLGSVAKVLVFPRASTLLLLSTGRRTFAVAVLWLLGPSFQILSKLLQTSAIWGPSSSLKFDRNWVSTCVSYRNWLVDNR